MGRWLGRQLLRLGYVRTAVREKADLQLFKKRPPRRLWVGIVLVFLGLLFGWPLLPLFGALALALGDPELVTVIAPVVYGASWVIYLAGFIIGGWAAVRYVRALNRWLARVLAEWLLRGSEIPQAPDPDDGS